MTRSVTLAIALLSLGFLIVGSVSAQESTPLALDEPQTLVLVEQATEVVDIDLGEPGPSVGDLRVWGPDPMVDPKTLDDAEATTQGTCIFLDETSLCLVSETIVFDDGSTLILQGVQSPGSDESVRTIVAGSGLYRGATGTMLVQPSDDLSTWTKTIEIWLS